MEWAILGAILLATAALTKPRFVAPLEDAYVTSGYGDDRSYRGPGATHQGIDFRASVGTRVGAVAKGIVTRVQPVDQSHAGKWLRIDHQNGYWSEYLHLDKAVVKVGQKVKAKQLIAYSGDTGAGGPHLHLQMKLNNKPVPAESLIPARYSDHVKKQAKKLGIKIASH